MVFPQKFRQIDVLLKNLAINWLDGKTLHGSEFLGFPHTKSVENWSFWQKFRESNVFTKEVTKELISHNIFGKR